MNSLTQESRQGPQVMRVRQIISYSVLCFQTVKSLFYHEAYCDLFQSDLYDASDYHLYDNLNEAFLKTSMVHVCGMRQKDAQGDQEALKQHILLFSIFFKGMTFCSYFEQIKI